MNGVEEKLKGDILDVVATLEGWMIRCKLVDLLSVLVGAGVKNLEVRFFVITVRFTASAWVELKEEFVAGNVIVATLFIDNVLDRV